MSSKIQQLRDSNNGELPAYVWPGGYPLFYLDKDNSVLCPACANANDEEVFPLVDYDVNWEDEEMFCDECSQQIHSAYGNDNE